MAKIEAPNKGYNGTGPGGAVFKDGKAETDDEAAINYYRSAGYTVDGESAAQDGGDVADPRDIDAQQVVGTRLRDAAVDPQPEDFLPPVNAGQANPHGPQVVAPEVHASGPAGIRPGQVQVEDPRKQEAREKAFAEARLVQRVGAAEAVEQEVGDLDDRGPVGLSDPGSADAGRAAATDDTTSDEAKPRKAASRKSSK